MNKAVFVWLIRISTYVVKTANPSRIQPVSWLTAVTVVASWSGA